jgi:hypothetical protein
MNRSASRHRFGVPMRDRRLSLMAVAMLSAAFAGAASHTSDADAAPVTDSVRTVRNACSPTDMSNRAVTAGAQQGSQIQSAADRCHESTSSSDDGGSSQSSTDQGATRGTDQGAAQDGDPGTARVTASGTDPGAARGGDPGAARGGDPGAAQGTDPDTDEGANQSVTRGTGQGAGRDAAEATPSGSDSGAEQSTSADPGTARPTVPGADPVPGADAVKATASDSNQVQDTGANGPTPPADGANAAAAQASLAILGKDCATSKLEPHDGFQKAPRCVSTAFGEVAAAADDASLLISKAPRLVRVGQAFDLTVSTRNLVRDRFLAAGKGGYYVESSFLNNEGLVRGHFHTACRMLESRRTAPDPAPVPAFFVATEDGGGGAAPDTVTVRVAGLPTRGVAQCAVWAGDGSHRIPMMERANQVPAFDVVRIAVL